MIKDLNLDNFSKEKIYKKIKNIDLIDNRLLVSFWKKYSVYEIDIYNLWKEFRNIFLNNMKNAVSNKNDNQILLSMKISIFLSRIIKLENSLNFNKNYDFLDYQYNQFTDIFNLLVNTLDKLNLIPIQIDLIEKNKEKAMKLTKKKIELKWIKKIFFFLKETKKKSFKNGFYKKTFNSKVDKINFYENYLSEARNQITHYPVVYHEIKSNDEVNIILIIYYLMKYSDFLIMM